MGGIGSGRPRDVLVKTTVGWFKLTPLKFRRALEIVVRDKKANLSDLLMMAGEKLGDVPVYDLQESVQPRAREILASMLPSGRPRITEE